MQPADAIDPTGPATRRSGGRPTREAARERDLRLLAVAASMFEQHGYDATSMDAVAEAAGVGKPTIYNRFRDKAELFEAVLGARIERFLSPLGDGVRRLIEAESAGAGMTGAAVPVPDMETVLFKIGMRLLPHALAPETLAINRIVIAESVRFVRLARLAHREGWQAMVSILATLLEFYASNGRIVLEDATEGADLFLSLLLGRLQRAAIVDGQTMDHAAIERRVRMAVNIFLRGAGA